jgi:hypothetical protein
MITLLLCIALLLVVIERQRRKIKTLSAENNRYKNARVVFMKARKNGMSWMQENLGPWPEMTPEKFKREYECNFLPRANTKTPMPSVKTPARNHKKWRN